MDYDFSQARELFERCLTLDADARRTCLFHEDVTPALRARVEAMLRAEASSVPLLDRGVAAAFVPSPPEPPRSDAFEILRELGRGGMGAVYLAQQRAPRRLVALKRIGQASSPAARERFRLEADALARLQHPGIAAIHGVERDTGGDPFLVIEYVDGRPLHAFAAPLEPGEKLQLLAAIADAVEHAHSRGVIHRDLKPGNLLVTAGGQPKVLDFGIARLAAVDGRDALTQEGVLLGTPAYMSPEQASGSGELGPASDVYSLGVIGYELLAGCLPVSVSGLPALLAVRAIAEQEPTPLSRVVPALKGDIDSIFRTALAKDAADRYPNAAAFADDLRRVLAHEPVRARRASTWRRLHLFARRNRALSASLALAFVALAAGTLAATWFALGERGQRVRAEAALDDAKVERDRADATLRFLTALLAEANPARSGKPDVAVRDILDRALPRVEALPGATQAPLLLVLADALSGFGATSRITPLYERALALSTRYATPQQLASARARYGRHLLDLGRVVDARQELRAVVVDADALDARERRRAMADLGRAEAQLGNERAVRALRQSLLEQPGPTPDDGEVPPEMSIAFEEMRMLSDYGDGEGLARTFEDVMPRAVAALGKDHPFVLSLGRFESAVRFHQRDDAGSLASAERSLARHRAILGDTHADTLRAKAYLGNAHLEQGNLPRALEIVEESRALARASLPDDSALHLELLALEVFPRHYLQRYDVLLQEGPGYHERYCSARMARHEYCGLLAFGLALATNHAADIEASDQWLSRADEFLTQRLGADNPLVAISYAMLARQHGIAGRRERAVQLAQRAAAMLDRRPDIAPRRYAPARAMLAYAYVDLGRPDLALPLARASVERDAASGAVPQAPSAHVLALALSALDRPAEALAVLERAWAAELARPIHAQDRTDLARAFVRVLADSGDRRHYRRWARELRAQVDAGGNVPPHDVHGLAALDATAR